MPVSEYLHHHETSWLELQRTSPQLLSYEDQTIYTTWNLSYIYIRKEDESAAKLLELWAYFDNRDLWYDLLQAGEYKAPGWFLDVIKTKLTFTSVIAKLQKHALVERLIESDSYSMHHCVHAWVRNVLCNAVDDQNMRLAFTCIGYSVPGDPVPGDWRIKQRLLPHSASCLQYSRVWSSESNDHEETDDRVLKCIGNLARLYHAVGKLMEAETMNQRVLAGQEKILGKDHISTLKTVNNLGNHYRDQGRLTEAELMYQRALTGREKVLGKNHISTIFMINSLGTVYSDQGKLTEADSMFQRALIGREKALGKDHSSTLDTVHNLGFLYKQQGKLPEANSMFQRALIGREKALGKDHSSTLDTVYSLGILYSQQGKLPEADSMFQRALIGREKALGQDHIKTLNTISALGNLYDDQGKLREAESMYQRALLGCTRNPPPNVKSQLDLFYNMGLLYQRLKNFESAKDFYNQAYEGYQKLLGSQHAETIDALEQLNEIERDIQGAESTDEQSE